MSKMLYPVEHGKRWVPLVELPPDPDRDYIREQALAGLRAILGEADARYAGKAYAAVAKRTVALDEPPRSPCDADCLKCANEKPAWRRPRAVDPLSVEYDGVTLCQLISRDEKSRRREVGIGWHDPSFTSVQRAAVSAHWSAELRAKVAASKERERCRVLVDLEDE